jgi:hypothetical protein
MNGGLDFGEKRKPVCGRFIFLKVVYICRMFLKMTLNAETFRCSQIINVIHEIVYVVGFVI